MVILKVVTLLFSVLSFAWIPQEEPGMQNEKPDAIIGVGIDEMLNEALPGEAPLMNDRSEPVKLSDYYGNKKPVILSMVYYSCPSLCNLHLKGVFDVFRNLGLKAGKDFEFVAVSIDPKETPYVAAAKKDTYMEEYGLKDQANGIHFLTGSDVAVAAVAKKVGFKYKWIEEEKEWAHASAAILATPQGKISRYLHGVYFEPETFRLSLIEASQGKIGNLVDQFTLMCFKFDPKTNKFAFYGFNAIRITAGILVLFLLVWLVPIWWRQRRKKSLGF